MHLKRILFLFFTICFTASFAQVKIGQWVDHLSYEYCNAVAKVGETVYFSNGSGLAKYNTGDNSVQKLTKIEGLSDVGIKYLRKNDYNDLLLVIYSNTNIDLISPDGSIINISDLKRKIISGKKYINEVYFKGKLAYLSCGFGIVVFDTEKLEIKDTYYIGNGITNSEVYNVTSTDSAFFAATQNGIYYGNKTKNLANFQNWLPLNTGIAPGPYNAIVNLNGKIIANYSERIKSDQTNKDTLYQYDGVSWIKYPYKPFPYEIRKIYDYSRYNVMCTMEEKQVNGYDINGNHTIAVNDYGFALPDPLDFYLEGDGYYWMADKVYSLNRLKGSPLTESFGIKINGPANNYVNDMDISGGVLGVASVNLGATFDYQYSWLKPSFYKDGEWHAYSSNVFDTIRDVNCVAMDPNDNNHVVYGAMLKGLIEIKNNSQVNVWTESNSPLTGIASSPSDIRITGVNFDDNSNLWTSITLGKYALIVHKADNTWKRLDFNQIIINPTVTKVIVDQYHQAWILLARNVGLMIYQDAVGFPQPNSGNTKLANASKGNGFLPTTDLYSMCEDKDGHIWVGTAKGIAVFYNPENVFSGANWDSQQILIEQDGHVQVLLENDLITAIAVDGANRKWIGTQASGVYCFSPDGQKQIYHFTTYDSPLYSNSVRDIVTDETTGDVFIATEQGIQSFRTSIIKGFDEFENVHAYPNPIRPGNSGPVYITGLIDEAVVKITDVTGNLVWQTKSEGGQVEWDMKGFNGNKVASGVYLIFCSSANGDKSATSKLLIVN